MAKAELTDTQVQGHPKPAGQGSSRDIDLRDDVATLTAAAHEISEERHTRKTLNGAQREAVRRMRAEQGLPPKIADPAVISRVATLLEPNAD